MTQTREPSGTKDHLAALRQNIIGAVFVPQSALQFVPPVFTHWLMLRGLQVQPGALQRLQGPGGFTLLHMACADSSLYATASTSLSLMMGGFYHQQRLWGTQGPGSAEVVQLLLAAGADPDAGTTSGATALHIAACSNSGEIIRLLLAAGATLKDNRAYKGAPCLMLRCAMGGTAGVWGSGHWKVSDSSSRWQWL